ncbi:MAG: zinc-dependent metalloprotease [Bacteroidia bacterium]
MKKILLTTAAAALLSASAMAQGTIGKPVKMNLPTKTNQATQRDYSKPSLKDGQLPNRGCATPTPSKEWDAWFNQKVEEHKQDLANGRATASTYTIPIIFHVIYSTGEAVGSGHNLSQAQINSQIPILNADYGGTGYNSSQYAGMSLSGHGPFYDYAVANSLPAPDNNGTIIANSGITFCLATKNVGGTTLAEPGIDRITWESISGATDPASAASPSAMMTLMDGTIKPATIWDPTKYFNVWTSDGGTAGLLGYSSFPSGTTLSGLSGGGSSNETSTTSGCWVAYQSVGNTGNVTSPYNYGRTLTHESGHYFGLRHIWGDGTCADDYCNDTPPAAAANYVAWPTAYPYNVGTCTGSPNNSTDGEMFMAFMDYSDDAAMWMFTTDEVTRMQTALAQCPNRSGLTASAANLCNITLSTPVAAFTPPTSICATQNTQFTDASSGPPTSWNWSVNPTTGVTITTSSVQSPTINFTNPGTYTVTDAVSNSAGSNSVSHTVSVTSCTISGCDTVTHITNTDTLALYTTGTGTAGGYFMGTNHYGFTGLAEAYAPTDFPTGSLNIKGAIILFFRQSATIGTHGVSTHTATTLSMVNSSTNPVAAAAASTPVTFANIAATTGVTHVDYAGNPALGYANPIIVPYVAMFTTPVPLTTAFFMTLTMPPAGDTIALFSGSQGHNATCTAWVDYSGSWAAFSSLGTPNEALAVIPIACSPSAGIENNQLGSNINLFPNPNSGLFTFAISLNQATNLNFTVVNTLGQVVYTKTESNVLNTVLSCDLSYLAKGVYYAHITDSNNNRTVKKIIIE